MTKIINFTPRSGTAIGKSNYSNVKITPSLYYHEITNWDLDSKIRVFEEQINGWIFNIVSQILKIKHSDFIILNSLMAYFEMRGKLTNGINSEGLSKRYFEEG